MEDDGRSLLSSATEPKCWRAPMRARCPEPWGARAAAAQNSSPADLRGPESFRAPGQASIMSTRMLHSAHAAVHRSLRHRSGAPRLPSRRARSRERQEKAVRARSAVLAAMGVGGLPKLEQLSADQMAASIAAQPCGQPALHSLWTP